MKTYWDHTERERSEMTEEQVRDLLDLELMQQGVLKVLPPKVEELTPVVLPKERVFTIRHKDLYGSGTELDVVFATIEHAEAFLRLAPKVRCYRYGVDAHVAPLLDPSICPEDLPTKTTVEAKESVLRENTAKQQRNDAARREYDSAIAKIDKATEGIWNDWRACQAKRDRMQKIADTRAEYLRLTGGVGNLADIFLAKAFRSEELAEEREWSGLARPVTDCAA